MRILVTGATSGIGKETARVLAERGHVVVVHGRSESRVAAAIDDLDAKIDRGRLHPQVCDLSSQAAIRTWVDGLLNEAPLDVVIHNAGVWQREFTHTVDGRETTWAVNHLAPFLITRLLLDQLLARPHSRVINVSSIGHRSGSIRLDDPDFASGRYDGITAYCQSKLANVLFTQELARRTEGTGLVTHALHPGVVATKLLTETGFGHRATDTPSEAASTSIFLATDPDVARSSGGYYVDCRAKAPATRDPHLARRLWALSERHVGLS